MSAQRILPLAALLALGCCGGDDDDSSTPEEQEAERLLAEVQADDYRSYDRMRGWDIPLIEATTPRHGAFVDIYINPDLAAALEAGPPFPEGAIVVKDGWNDAEGTDFFGTSIMRKDGDGWFWADYDAGGRPTQVGPDLDTCLECHGSGADGLLTF